MKGQKMEIFESLLRVALVAGLLWFGWALFVMLTDKDSPLRSLCLGCGSDLQRVDVVHCSKCLGV
jgi:hypothetical protein